ncbi:MAG: potassium channel family protein [Polyangiaceae bacterium]|nr:potassium channel family protein [Polyangiaceae bacterium]
MDLLRRAVSRVLYSLLAVAVVVVVGGVALWWLGGTEYGFGDAVFFALISATTVGFSELPHLGEHAGGRLVTAVVIVAGVASIATLQSTLTALLVEGAIGRAFRRRRMQDKVAALKDHLVVAGCGRTGRYLIEELAAVHTRFVVIDRDEAAIQKLDAELGGRLLWVNGDATDDHTLLEARVPAAAGIVSALTDDRDNLFVTLSARSLAPRARIVAKVV